MAQLKPKAVAFIATELSLPVAEELRQQAIKLGITALEPVLLADPDNPALCRKLTAELLVELADHGRLAVDVTGGRTPMSLGAFMAAEELGAGTLYVSCQYPNGKPDMASAAIVCISTPT
jgi:predicted neuraminidase